MVAHREPVVSNQRWTCALCVYETGRFVIKFQCADGLGSGFLGRGLSLWIWNVGSAVCDGL